MPQPGDCAANERGAPADRSQLHVVFSPPDGGQQDGVRNSLLLPRHCMPIVANGKVGFGKNIEVMTQKLVGFVNFNSDIAEKSLLDYLVGYF